MNTNLKIKMKTMNGLKPKNTESRIRDSMEDMEKKQDYLYKRKKKVNKNNEERSDLF